MNQQLESRWGERPLLQLAVVAALFCLAVSAFMLTQHALAAERDPWKSPQLLALKEQLRSAPKDENVKAEIRRLDLEFRERYKRRLALDRTGGWLLVGGIVVLLLTTRAIAKSRTRPWLPQLRSNPAEAARAQLLQSRKAIVGVGIIITVGLATLALTSNSMLPKTSADLDRLLGRTTAGETLGNAPTSGDFESNWPMFRGYAGRGQAAVDFRLTDQAAPVIRWQVGVPAAGFNSPIVWGNRLFFSGGDAERREVFCFHTADGKLLWQRKVEKVAGAPIQIPEVMEATGYAASTMATDGARAFAIFATAELVAVNFDGSQAWSRYLGPIRNMYGHASSLAIAPGRLIVQLDQDEGAPGGSKLLALDPRTGRTLWEQAKPTHGSWASPIVFGDGAKAQVVSLALPFAMGHALSNGTELWRAELMNGEIAPSPTVAGNFIVFISPSDGLMALRPDAAGDATQSGLVWKSEDNIPDITSPVGNGEFVFTVSTMGTLACAETGTGKLVWQHELEFEVQASPVLAANQVLVLGTQGELVAVEAGREFKSNGKMKLADSFFASPAFGAGRMFLRGATNLWCLEGVKEVANAR